MGGLRILKSALVGGASVVALASPSSAKMFDIPDGDLSAALGAYVKQSSAQIIYVDDVVRGHKSHGAHGDYTETAALTQLLRGTGFTSQATATNAIEIVPAAKAQARKQSDDLRVAAAAPRAPAPGAVETVVVTAQKKSENIQNVPIAVTALSQQQLTERQIAGGPDLLRDVPNMNFGKTNFTGYSIELRGIGTQAISVTTDPAVAVAFNGTPFIRNHFFEQEFYDLSDVEVLRGPQGTLYGRNATAGVVNLKSALPTDQFEAMGSVDIGNFSNRRLEGMLNIPIAGDKLDLRMAGEWTMRDGYSFDTLTNKPVDGRDLWSTRGTLRWRPNADLDVNLVWEHFSEDDGRMRTAKQLCKTDPAPSEVGGIPLFGSFNPIIAYSPALYLSQGCLPASLYSPQSFEVPNGYSLPYYDALNEKDVPIPGGQFSSGFDPYASTTQSTNLRNIQSSILPQYKAKNDTLELNVDYNVTPSLTFTSQTGYNNDFLWSTEDYNRFETAPGAFEYFPPVNGCGGQDGVNAGYNNLCTVTPDPNTPPGSPYTFGIFCDPQLGCSDRLVAEDLSDERSWQLSQEFRLTSNFSGPLNFSVGGNYLHYETEENYYVFINSLSFASYVWANGTSGSSMQTLPWVPGVSDNSNCMRGGFQYSNPYSPNNIGTSEQLNCMYIDPNPIGSLNNQGHNYFLSQNPYVLNSYAGFGEAYYDITRDIKLTGGLRWTVDQKHFLDIPSELLIHGYGYPVTAVVNQSWSELTGRSVLDWTPQLDFTDQTLFYASYAHGYKAGGANPPGALLPTFNAGDISNPIHPLTFKPEHIEAFELGTKNSVLGGSMTLNGDIFYYNYHDYQISRIVDRTAINDNFNAHVMGAEFESTWEPTPGLRFNLAAGYEDATVGKGMQSVDLMDRTAGTPGWMVVKPFVAQTSNCVLPTYVVAALVDQAMNPFQPTGNQLAVAEACDFAYNLHLDPATSQPYNPATNFTLASGQVYTGFDPLSVDPSAPANVNGGLGLPPNNGEGFDKNLSGHKLPNAPPVTLSFGAQYSMPISSDWAATLRGDFYFQADSWARVFNDNPYDRLHGYTNLNLALIFESADGWQVMGYVKNVFDTTAITGDFLNSDDSGLTTNVFLTDPRLYGVRVTKNFGEGDSGAMADAENWIADLFADKDNGRPPLWIELGGQLSQIGGGEESFAPAVADARPSIFSPSQKFEQPPRLGFEETGKISYQPADSDWVVSASVRYGRAVRNRHAHEQVNTQAPLVKYVSYSGFVHKKTQYAQVQRFADTASHQSEQHLVLDFQAGKDVGLGMFGSKDSSTLNLGLRFAHFQSGTNVALRSDPDAKINVKYYSGIQTAHGGPGRFIDGNHYHSNAASLSARRSFHGIGPSISWNGSVPAVGTRSDGELDFDWGLNAALLFGRQRVVGHHQTTSSYHNGKYSQYNFRAVVSHANVPIARSRTVTVPNIGAMAGISWRYDNAKVSFGYRADEFFGAMDGGIDSHKSENRGFFGPYANISIGLGG